MVHKVSFTRKIKGYKAPAAVAAEIKEMLLAKETAPAPYVAPKCGKCGGTGYLPCYAFNGGTCYECC